jgi:hypothetical protein
MKVEPKAQRERRIFEWFAKAAELQVLGGIEQPDPPDIVVEVAGQGRVAFELVCVDARSAFFQNEKFRKTDTAMECGLTALPEAKREVLTRNFADAEINVQLADEVPWKAVSLQPLWDILEMLPPGFEGEARCPPAVAQFLWIYRHTSHVGPTFSTIGGGWVPNINLAAIENKLAKKYETTAPLELLAYSQLHDIAHRADFGAVRTLACAQLRGSSFRRLWLFDGMLQKVELSVAVIDQGVGAGLQIFPAKL